ncbi:MAG: class I SAM-dependent methyltransferase [Syntrophomonadaceae bacterium]|nr:class I SAM-dependent methyltransferase [Syntrophomonadaceae bacterium]
MYYTDKINILKDIFACEDISLNENALMVDGKIYPIVNDVIILLEKSRIPVNIRGLEGEHRDVVSKLFDEDIQYTFGEEWKKFDRILPEHQEIFEDYFDLLDLSELNDYRMCDLGCGIGRWSFFLTDKCKELLLLDFSEAIFVARRNLQESNNVLYFMADINDLPFRNDFCDIIFSLGVLHHLPNNALEAVRMLNKYAPVLLIYLYYALDNRPWYFRSLLNIVTIVRSGLCKIRTQWIRSVITWSIALLVYKPLVGLGKIFQLFGCGNKVPLYEAYNGKSIEGIRQDVYDRFFTGIEQRFAKKDILKLNDTYREIIISDKIPYWHFLCKR